MLIAGQAAGRKVYQSGIPFDDATHYHCCFLDGVVGRGEEFCTDDTASLDPIERTGSDLGNPLILIILQLTTWTKNNLKICFFTS